jgi:hypothetical protein
MEATMGELIVTVFVAVVVLGPLVYRLWRDRLEDRALAVHAEVDSVLRRRLHGDSLVSVAVTPALPWHAGRVSLWAPRDWQPVLGDVSAPVLEVLPDDYELVVRSARHTVHAPAETGPVKLAA